jgi:hypothetical protein
VSVVAVLGAAVAVVQAQSPDPATTAPRAAAAPVQDDVIAEAFEEAPEVNRSAERPELPVEGTDDLPLGTQPCNKMSEAGLQPDTVKVFRAVCERFPQVGEYGGIAGRGEHATGQALDIMVRGSLGDEIAAFLQEHRSELGIEYLIWEQRIWRPATSASWRPMSDRGGDTANHVDHVHVTTYGSAATG